MIFQHTWDMVLEGTKTRTSRLIKPGEWLGTTPSSWPRPGVPCVYRSNGRIKWAVGETYAIQPGRGKAGLWMNPEREASTFERLLNRYGSFIPRAWHDVRIRLTGISRQDVRQITVEEARAEGFGGDRVAFWYVWCTMHDLGTEVLPPDGTDESWLNTLAERPAGRYDAWVLEFELVDGRTGHTIREAERWTINL